MNFSLEPINIQGMNKPMYKGYRNRTGSFVLKGCTK